MSSELELLKATEIFRDVPEEHLERLAQRAVKRRYDAGETVFAKADPGSAAFVVEYGEVQIIDRSDANKLVTLAYNQAGDIFGELALFDGEARSADAVATTDTRCLILKREDFMELLLSEAAMAREIMSLLARMIRRMNEMISWAGTHPHKRLVDALVAMTDRYGHRMSKAECSVNHVKIETEPIMIDRPVTDADLASNSQMYPGEVGPLLANLQYKDIIRREGATIIVVRPKELVKAGQPPVWLAK